MTKQEKVKQLKLQLESLTGKRVKLTEANVAPVFGRHYDRANVAIKELGKIVKGMKTFFDNKPNKNSYEGVADMEEFANVISEISNRFKEWK